MDKMTELNTVTALVEEVMRNFPASRNSDDTLYLMVCERVDAISINMSFKDIILNRKEYGYPAYECVARAGRKVRARYPELKGNIFVEEKREENKEIFKEYAKG